MARASLLSLTLQLLYKLFLKLCFADCVFGAGPWFAMCVLLPIPLQFVSVGRVCHSIFASPLFCNFKFDYLSSLESSNYFVTFNSNVSPSLCR